MKAVIQAGGKGTRLRPFTVVLPKPLVPVGDVPIIEILLRWLCRGGVEEAFITLGYLGKIIRAACGDGSEYGLPITYVQEDTPLNTVGALRLVGRERLSETFFSLNGDILTDLNLRELAAFHKAHGGVLTVATTKKDIPTNLGVMDIERDRITAFREKPVLHQTVSMGVYCMEPEILDGPGPPPGFCRRAGSDRQKPEPAEGIAWNGKASSGFRKPSWVRRRSGPSLPSCAARG